MLGVGECLGLSPFTLPVPPGKSDPDPALLCRDPEGTNSVMDAAFSFLRLEETMTGLLVLLLSMVMEDMEAARLDMLEEEEEGRALLEEEETTAAEEEEEEGYWFM